MKLSYILPLALALCSSTAFAASSATKDFVQNAGIGGKFEIDSSKLALEKSQSDEIKEFAQMMIDDHSKANDELKSDLKGDNATLLPTSLDDKHQSMIDKLQAAKGQDFDSLYLKDQKAAHKEAISAFGKYAKSGDDATLKSFASKTLPTLKKHKEHLKDVKADS